MSIGDTGGPRTDSVRARRCVHDSRRASIRYWAFYILCAPMRSRSIDVSITANNVAARPERACTAQGASISGSRAPAAGKLGDTAMEGLADTRSALAFLAAVTDAFAEHEELQRSLDALASAMLPALGDACLIDVVPPLGEVSCALAAVDKEVERGLRELRRLVPISSPRAEGPIARAMAAEAPIVVDSVEHELERLAPNDPVQARLFGALRLGSLYVVPMRLGRHVEGAMTFGFARDGGQRADEIRLAIAGELARRVAWVIERARRASVAGVERAEHVEALRRRREEYRALVEHSPDIVSRLDRDKRHLYVSRTIELIGMSADELLGRTYAEAGVAPELADAWDAMIERVFGTGQAEAAVFTFETPGGRRAYESRFVPELAADGSVATVIRISRDVTDERESARAMQRANRGLEVLSRGMEEIARATDEDQLFARVCDLLASVGGFRLAWIGAAVDAPGKPVRPLSRAGVESSYVDDLQTSWDEAQPTGRGPTGLSIRTGEPTVFRDVSADRDFAPWRTSALAHGFGSTLALPLLAGGRIFGALAIYSGEVDAFDADEVALLERLASAISLGVDAMRAKQARDASEAALRQREEHFRGLIENASDAILEVSADRIVRYASPALRRILGFDAGEVTGRPVLELLVPEARARAAAVLSTALETPGVVHTFATAAMHGDGGRRELEIVGHRPAGEAEPRLVLHARDVTERTRLDEHLRETQKLDALNRLAASVAHDFNNVLTIIQGAGSMLRLRVRDQERAREEVDEILSATDRAAALTRQMLLFTRRAPEEPKIVDVRGACADVERMVRRLLGVDIELELQLRDDSARVRIDPGQLEQVVLNLVVNARDAMPEGGRLTLRVDVAHLAAPLDSVDGAIPPGDWVRLTVSDTGSGVDPAIVSRIFDPFFTTKPAGRGTGLGLSTVRSIVHRAGGYVRVETEAGRGARFVVHLPRTEGDADAPRPRGDRASRGTELVLLVDDDEQVRRLSARALRAHGYEVLEAQDGAEALEAFARVRDRVALVVTDLVMPRLRGQALAERLAQQRPALPVLFVSALTDEIQHDGLGPRRALLPKPFTPDALLSRVRELLDRR